MDNIEDLLKVIEHIDQNVATDEEIRIYNAWCNSFQKQGLEIPAFSDIQSRMLQNIDRQIDEKRPTVKLWPRIVAAVAIILIIGAVILFDNKQNVDPNPPQLVVENDIPPGKNTATLTLADGSKIILSEVKNGKLTEQEGVVITKTADGKVIYNTNNLDPDTSPLTKKRKDLKYNTLSTARAEQYQIVLPDGTKVWLNAATTLRFPASFAGMSKRNVELTGEAYFEVAKDKTKPFIVHSDQQEVEVLGTHFNINNYTDEPMVKTTLLEGSVKVNQNNILKPGEQAAINKAGDIKISMVPVEEAIAWKKGYFEFNDENVYEIMRKISRWYDVQVIYEGDIPLNGMEGTMSRFQNVSKVLDIMQSTGLLRFRIEGKKIYVNKA